MLEAKKWKHRKINVWIICSKFRGIFRIRLNSKLFLVKYFPNKAPLMFNWVLNRPLKLKMSLLLILNIFYILIFLFHTLMVPLLIQANTTTKTAYLAFIIYIIPTIKITLQVWKQGPYQQQFICSYKR